MSHPQSSSVHRYFPPADSFVEVRRFGTDSTILEAPRGMDGASYRQFVIQTCMPRFATDLAEELKTLFPEAPEVAEEVLYDLCVEVNPGLEINKVHLHTKVRKLDAALEALPQSDQRGADTLERLARTSRDLERRLKRKVHGQDAAIETLCRAVLTSAAGLRDFRRPLGCFLFVGRTGTGKTELSRCLAKELSEDPRTGPDNLIRIDCSEYALAHEYSKLIGSPPGYVGHEEGGQFSQHLKTNPEAVILFDEIEKAHPRMHNLLLQVLEEGCLTDGKGHRLDLSRNFVLMTSNAGAEDMRSATQSLGFHSTQSLTDQTLHDLTHRALDQTFSPEFLGRLDEIVLFSELGESTAHKIAQDQLTQLAIRARRRGVRVAFTPAVARWVTDQGFDPRFGARELRSVIQREVEPMLAQVLLSGDVEDEDLVRARIHKGKLLFHIEK